MSGKLEYHVVRHDGGWAYKAGGTFSEVYLTHDQALAAARRAAEEQRAPGDTTGIYWEDGEGKWHSEISRGDDRPTTTVDG